jgi:acyl-CoA hydrolase
VIAYADGPDSPRSSPEEVAGVAGLEEAEVLLGWLPEGRDWLDGPGLRTVLAGYALAGPVADGRVEYLPVRLSSVPRLLASTLRPDVAVVSGIRRGGSLAFGASVGWGPAAAAAARKGVVVEVDEQGADLGGPLIPGRLLATLPRPSRSGRDLGSRPPDEVDDAIGRRVAALLPEEATIQLGPGGVAEAVLASVERPVHVLSGLVTDGVARLEARGLLLGVATAAYAWGGPPLVDLHRRGRLRLAPVEETHDLGRLAAVPRFVACNTALQVGLDGSVNVERIGSRYVAGIGGHADFSAGAARSPGGLSVVALRATTRSGDSTIVASVETVSTPRCDVEVVVTEHGVADLRGVGDAERGRRLAAIAAPEHRPALLART